MKPIVSIVIPAYNEEDCLAEVHDRLTQVLSKLETAYEILFVDDGSADGTFERIRSISDRDPTVRGLRLSRNFGHQAALTAGLEMARGEAVITMDADLQHPPELLPELIARWREGYEVVYTVRKETSGAGVRKNLTSSLFYWLINSLSPLTIVPGAADFRLLDRKAVEALKRMPEKTRFFRGMIPWIGFKQIEVPFSAPERFAGNTKYSFRKMLRFAAHGILSQSAIPLRMATILGAFVVFVGFLYGLYVVWTFFTKPPGYQQGWASIVLFMLLIGGTQIFFMGIIGEYLARVFEEVKNRPLYLVAEETETDPDS
ncbi:MAG: glycosyltransferase family 2 protein [Candidatus Omnitrophica bacterium]|nr:glycosyltransferase family 2 protein [Candidatus Omnitrophota bacterium]MCA9426517.1 glycosyltransferase family 2 protein [Candidatus Omnitrophota bacterium]MCA9429375.1 glycosyltransferase family 2 protein [Candidatus Omnitrophota bacterium]MCA9437144.1 glycosyltransferase family 2 protein [Candidatus Omnitrophota bacterium]MCA9446154.1 glycosyltransferase family 2 protein [Candidatus Omnitrophota bacterium]